MTKILKALLFTTILCTLNAAPVKIMMLGDSITEGGGHIPDNPENNQSAYTGSKLIQNPDNISYRAKLFDLFIADGYTVGNSDSHVDFVGSRNGGSNYPTAFDRDHQGTSGWTSKQIRDEIDGYLTETPADIILLHIGTNDPGGISIGDNNDSEDANTTVNNVKQILNKIFAKNPNTKVFVARIIEARRSHTFSGGIVTPDNPWGVWNTTVLNDNIEEMVAAHPDTSNIKMVNMQSGAGLIYDPCGTNLGDMQPFHSDDNNKADLHPNENGYAKMAQTWFDELVASDCLTNIDTNTTLELIQGGANDNGELDTSKWSGVGMSHNEYVGTSLYQGINYLNSNPLANNGGMYQSIITEVGKRYTLKATLIGANHYTDINNFSLGKSYVGVEDSIPTPTNIPINISEYIIGETPQAVELTFTATSTITYISVRGDTAYRYPNVSMVSVKEMNNTTSDILWRSGGTNHLWQMQTDGSHTYVNIGTKSSSYIAEEIADFNGDGIVDILWRKGHKNYIWYMNTDGTHSYKKITSKSYDVVGADDFNNDGIADILWRKDNNNHIWYMNADGTHTYQNIGTKSTDYTIAGLGDLNGDGITDILWRKGYKNYIWYMNTDGTHSYKKIGSKSYNVQAVKDFNNDGIADILWRKDNNNHIWYMNTDGTYTYQNIGTKSSSYTLTQVGDYNGDGVNDILWRKGSSNYLWYMHTNGSHTYKKISGKGVSYVVVDGVYNDKVPPVDTTPPKIIISGPVKIVISVNEGFRDTGASATDDMDGNVEVTTTGTVDTSTPGTYIITYAASDTAGNTAEATRTVVVHEAIPELTDTEIAEYLNVINTARAQARTCGVYGDFPAVSPVTWSDKLYKAAYEHSQDMTKGNFFSHDGSGESADWTGFILNKQSNMVERIQNYGYQWIAASENITAGTSRDTAQKAIDSWLSSDGHCKNIMNPMVTEVGMALSSDANTEFTNYWTQNFARSWEDFGG